ncbi:SDR family NAD(P)-dependent oxidoreductase [Streptomyces triticirhizae]|uniref:SDR family NAD(P)-dependent oxidoreductase n=1 Tax=Streptomyces triticirhizae TaxID=2483353 RepID=A0A3M2M793_9ACTN|nr:SDR family NAD(P)-dependent oxidoreductase [Streptomyces triticirhizae]RMI44850.1 SDR family NAD(P)-dependent oxidoreductase [Streptomyces triticirhizae]
MDLSRAPGPDATPANSPRDAAPSAGDEGRHWLVTGANSGLGAAVTRAALAAGDRVTSAVRRPETMDATLAAHPERLSVVRLDVTDPDRCVAALAEAEAAHGPLDVLVNNAGFGTVGAVEETGEDELRQAMEVMFHGPLRLTRLALPGMRRRRSGTIVQVTSMGGLLAFGGVGAYCAAKGALELASEALCEEVRPLGIRVLIVEPGAFRTGFNGALLNSRPIADYEATVGAVRDGMVEGDGRQSGDPDKAARALLAVLDLPEPPLRLALGDDAFAAIRAKLATVGAELDAVEHLATGAAINVD